MPDIVFEKGIVICTFLVSLADINLDALLRPDDTNAEANKEWDDLWLEPEPAVEIPDIRDHPGFWAEATVAKLFSGIIKKTRPQGVRIASSIQRKPADAEHVATIRQKIEDGEMVGHLVTIRLEFTRPDLSRPFLTKPYHLPFPGLSWLTSQVRDEPGNALTLLHMTAAQVPAAQMST